MAAQTDCRVLFLKSKIDGKEPLLTPEKYNRAVAYIRCDYSKASAVLGYRTSPLSVMIKDSLTWLKERKPSVRHPMGHEDHPIHRCGRICRGSR